MNMHIALMVVAALAAPVVSGVTEGWENVNPGREHIPPTQVVWTAQYAAAGNFTLEKHGGAEGGFEVLPDGLRVRKGNDRGFLVLKAPAFEAATNQMLRFFADVSAADAEPMYSLGFLRAHGLEPSLVVQPEATRHDSFLGTPEMSTILNTAPGMSVRKYTLFLAKEGIVTPMIIIAGDPSVSEWKNWTAEDDAAADRLWNEMYKAADRGYRNRRRPTLMSDAELTEKLAKDVDHTCRFEKFGDASRMLIDGKPAVPVIYLGMRHIQDYTEVSEALPLYEEGGVPVIAPTVPMGVTDDYSLCWTKEGFDAKKAVSLFRESMRGSGDALMMLTLNCNAYKEFVTRDYPGEGWLDEKGNQVVGTGGSSVVGYQGMTLDQCWPWVSMASRPWREQVKRNIRELVAEFKRQNMAKRIIGIHFQGYNDGQFGMNRPDFSEAARREYREEYLPEALAENRSTNYWYYCRQLNARLVNEFGREFKQAMGKDVVVFRRGDSPYVIDFAMGANARSEVIDVTVTGPSYDYRAPAVSCSMYVPFSSMNYHGKMVWNEFDLRAWYIRQSQSIIKARWSGEYADLAEWCSGYRKLAGEMIATRGGFWFYDMGRGWCSGEGIFADIRESLATMQHFQEKTPSPWHPEVAIVIDDEGFLGFDGGVRGFPAHTYQLSGRQLRLLGNAGVPYDYYLADDVIRHPELLKDKKTVVFMLWRKFDEQRLAFVKELRKRPRTLVFLAESGCLGGAKEATGFGLDFSWSGKEFLVEPTAEMKYRTTGILEFERITESYFGKDPKRPILPATGRRGALIEEPGVTVLGRFVQDGKAAIAKRTDDGVVSYYVSEPSGLSPDFFHAIVRESGAYAPVESGRAQVNMNGDFVSVHALKPGRFDFKLPFPCRVVNLKSGKPEAVKDEVMSLDMTAGETCWFELIK